MKRLGITAVGLALVALILVGCGSQGDGTASLSGCSKKDAARAYNALNTFFQQYSDLQTRAESTARIALSPIVGEMQAASRQLQEVQVPTCADQTKNALDDAYTDLISEFLSFMRQDPDSVVAAHASDSGTHFAGAMRQLLNLKGDGEVQ